MLSELQRDADLHGELDWDYHFVDGSVVRAHVSAAGGRGGCEVEALGRSRGGFSTKIHVRAEGGGKPMCFVLSGGERHEAVFLKPLLDGGAVRRRSQGRPRQRPRALVGDKGYSYPGIRRLLSRLRIRAVIPRRSDQRPSHRRHLFDRTLYRQRNRVERLIGRLKQYRRVATRYEKRAAHYLAMLTCAAILLWL